MVKGESSHFQKLREVVINKSNSKHWMVAVNEWEIYSCDTIENEEDFEECICSKEGLKYVFEIKNKENGNLIYPIGSTCINKFKRSELNKEVATLKKLLKLKSMANNKEKIEFSSELFSKKLIDYLYVKKALKPNKYNKFNERNDYQFLLDIFNTRRPTTEAQNKKVIALIMSAIIPFVKNYGKGE